MSDPSPETRGEPVLDYGRTPPRKAPRLIKCGLAIAFSFMAILYGGMLLLDGVTRLHNVRMEPTEYDARNTRRSGQVSLTFAAIVLIPGLWYGTAAIRELLRRDSR